MGTCTPPGRGSIMAQSANFDNKKAGLNWHAFEQLSDILSP